MSKKPITSIAIVAFASLISIEAGSAVIYTNLDKWYNCMQQVWEATDECKTEALSNPDIARSEVQKRFDSCDSTRRRQMNICDKIKDTIVPATK